MVAMRDAMDALAPPPFYENTVQQVEKRIDLTRDLIRAKVPATEQLKLELRALKKEWVEKSRTRDNGIRAAWLPYWETWGQDAGPLGLLRGLEGGHCQQNQIPLGCGRPVEIYIRREIPS